MKNWINILHFYQPFWQDKNILDKVVKESYSFLLNLLQEFPKFKITINFSGSLLELLNEQGYYSIIEKFNHFVKNGQRCRSLSPIQAHAFYGCHLALV